MNKYIVVFEWAGYYFCNTFHGENEKDPNMRKAIIEWMGQCPEDGQVAEAFIDDDRDNPPVRDFACYQIVDQEVKLDILEEAWDTYVMEDEENTKRINEKNKQRELEHLKYLKEKYEQKDV
jgi:hypothetical protein